MAKAKKLSLQILSTGFWSKFHWQEGYLDLAMTVNLFLTNLT